MLSVTRWPCRGASSPADISALRSTTACPHSHSATHSGGQPAPGTSHAGAPCAAGGEASALREAASPPSAGDAQAALAAAARRLVDAGGGGRLPPTVPPALVSTALPLTLPCGADTFADETVSFVADAFVGASGPFPPSPPPPPPPVSPPLAGAGGAARGGYKVENLRGGSRTPWHERAGRQHGAPALVAPACRAYATHVAASSKRPPHAGRLRVRRATARA
jgi:hypothetical protein